MVTRQTTSKRKSRSIKQSAPNKVMVLIHGAGHFAKDWHLEPIDKIKNELGRSFDCLSAYYADVTTSRALLSVDSPKRAKFKAALQKELEQSFAAAKASPTIPARRKARVPALSAPWSGYTATLQAVTDYFFDTRARTEIQLRLKQKLDEAKSAYDEIVLVSHSLGTVVSFDVLKQSADRYNIAYWFTLGAPLAKLRRLGRYDDRLGVITPQNVKRWYNVYDSTDLIADALGPSFPRPGYRIHDIFVDVGVDPNASHDYFNNSESLKIIAETLR